MSTTNEINSTNQTDLTKVCIFCKKLEHIYTECDDPRLLCFRKSPEYEANENCCNTFECEMCDEDIVENEDNKPIKLELRECEHVFCQECFRSLITKYLYMFNKKD